MKMDWKFDFMKDTNSKSERGLKVKQINPRIKHQSTNVFQRLNLEKKNRKMLTMES